VRLWLETHKDLLQIVLLFLAILVILVLVVSFWDMVYIVK
jgi:hypothetical protein